MKKHILNFLKVIVFSSILITSLICINQILTPKYILKNSVWPTTSSYNQFYEMDENSVDVIFLGSSVTVNAFSPQEIYNDYGIRSYNLGSEQQSIFLSYFWLKEALRFQTPQVVVLDTRFLFDLHPENKINTVSSLIKKCLDPMKWSEVKREAVSDLCAIDETQNELSYYLTNISYHSRWSEIKEYDVVLEETQYSQLKGYSPVPEYGLDSFDAFKTYDVEGEWDTQEVMQIYLNKMVDLCKDSNIQLVLVSLPGNFMNDEVNNTLTSYANKNNIDYYNMCEASLYDLIGAQLPRENTVNHANLWGSIKLSQYVGSLLKDTYHVTAVKDEQYESTREFYNHMIKNCELTHITDINEYLKMIDDDSYTIFISVKDDAATGLTSETKEALISLGLSNLIDKFRWSYAAVISPESGVQEILNENSPASLSGTIRNRNTFYSIESCGFTAGSSSSIIIDDKDYSINKRGINIVVYDNELMKFVDSVAFDTYGGSEATREK